MHPAIRSQSDSVPTNEAYNEITALRCEGKRRVRQEFKDDADINVLLARYGIGVPQRPVQYGEVDYTIDLERAYEATYEAETFWLNLPEEIQQKYPSWQAVVRAIENGQLNRETINDLKKKMDKKTDTKDNKTVINANLDKSTSSTDNTGTTTNGGQ